MVSGCSRNSQRPDGGGGIRAAVRSVYRTSGNLLLDRVLAATLHAFPAGEDEAAALAAEGRNPYVIHSVPGHPPLGGLGYRRGAWMAGIGLGAVMVAASLVAGLLGPVAIAL